MIAAAVPTVHEPLPAVDDGVVAGRRLRPAAVLAVVWGTILAIWLLVPEDVFFRVTHSERYWSTEGFLFIVACIATMIVGSEIGSSLPTGGARRRAGVADPIVLWRWGTMSLAVGLSAAAFLIGRGVAAGAGIGAVTSGISEGTGWGNLSSQYFTESRLQGVTTFVLALPAAGALLSMVAARSPELRSRALALVLAGAAGSLLVAFTLNDRLAFVEYLVTVLLVSHRMNPSRRQALVRAGLAVVLFGAVWSAAEYGRTYLPQSQDEKGVGALDLALDRFAAYGLTGVTNTMYFVDNFETTTFPYRTARSIYSTLSIPETQNVSGSAAYDESRRTLEQLYTHDPFVTFSAPGYMYMDLGWGALGLALLFGIALGAVHAGYVGGSAVAVLAFPILFMGMLDTLRILYFTSTRCILPILVIAIAARMAQPSRHSLNGATA